MFTRQTQCSVFKEKTITFEGTLPGKLEGY